MTNARNDTFWVVIPARYGSTRLPGKPLLDIGGKPMIRHVWERAGESKAARIIIATDDDRIRIACMEFGAEVCMTSDACESGTDRLAEVVAAEGAADDLVVVNIQGDEPLMPAENIDQVAALAQRGDTDIATLCVPIQSKEEFANPNVVKCVLGEEDRAVYFSRSPVPHDREDAAGFGHAFRHLGIYAYTVGALKEFSAMPPSRIEQLERLEQLRALAAGMSIRAQVAGRTPPHGVDTEADLELVRQQLG
ncbi:MAG: 3-deoxy-manno-octulosonate cytidylyltransferase [Gammaproteobacteria bacterium]|nr:3-deoxy-manno-octulosonate cytidylyltransferase [Gammaproteobacteria bacterium]